MKEEIKDVGEYILGFINPKYGPSLVFLTVIVILVVTLYQWHKKEEFKDFTLLELFAEGGRLSARKLFESGAFIITSTAFMIHVSKNPLTADILLAYSGIWVAARTAGQIVHSRKPNDPESGPTN